MRYLKFFNFILIVLQALFFIGISTLLFFLEDSFTELSHSLYGNEALLMNSYLIEFIANKFIAIIFFTISSIVLYKIIILSNLKQKVLSSIIINIVYISIGSWIIHILYS